MYRVELGAKGQPRVREQPEGVYGALKARRIVVVWLNALATVMVHVERPEESRNLAGTRPASSSGFSTPSCILAAFDGFSRDDRA